MRSGQYKGGEAERLAVLKYAAVLGAAYVDCEFLAASHFFASASPGPLFMLMMMVPRTQSHLHQPWRLDRCDLSFIHAQECQIPHWPSMAHFRTQGAANCLVRSARVYSRAIGQQQV